MRRFLYITPNFPPAAKVGSLRPAKFCRHLPDRGWEPIVLADLPPSSAIDDALMELVPAELQVRYDYGREARATWVRYVEGGSAAVAAHQAERGFLPPTLRERLPRALQNRDHSPSFWWPSQELLPLGHYALDIPHAVRAARRLVGESPVEAIVVNSEPHAAMVVGARVARAEGLPLVLDLRDPWSVCELKRPLRPAAQRVLVDRMERSLVEQAARVILNTETTRDDYRRHYADLPPELFDAIRNHADPDTMRGGSWPRRPKFSMVFLGNFRPFVEGDVLLRALARLRQMRGSLDDVELLVTGRVPDSARRLARELGVDGQLVDHPFIPYGEIGTFLQTADLLISLNNATRQRIPAKFYDYLVSDRPLLVIADNPELQALAREVGGATSHALHDEEGIATTMHAAVQAGRQRSVERRDAGLTSAAASARLAAILDDVVGAP